MDKTLLRTLDLDGSSVKNLNEVTIDLNFETICKVSGEPDRWYISISYMPDGKLIETVSLRDFLNSLRDDHFTVEEAGQKIYDCLEQKLDPEYLVIAAEVNPTSSPYMEAFWE